MPGDQAPVFPGYSISPHDQAQLSAALASQSSPSSGGSPPTSSQQGTATQGTTTQGTTQGRKTQGRKLKGENLGIGHVNIETQQEMVAAIKEGAFYREKQRDAWIGGMTTAFVLFIGFAIGGFFFYKSKISSVVENAVGSKLSEDEKNRLKADIGSFDGIQMLWYIGWGVFSFLIGYIIYFFTVRRWRRRQMIISKQQVQDRASTLASAGRLKGIGPRQKDGPMGGAPTNFASASQSLDFET